MCLYPVICVVVLFLRKQVTAQVKNILIEPIQFNSSMPVPLCCSNCITSLSRLEYKFVGSRHALNNKEISLHDLTRSNNDRKK